MGADLFGIGAAAEAVTGLAKAGVKTAERVEKANEKTKQAKAAAKARNRETELHADTKKHAADLASQNAQAAAAAKVQGTHVTTEAKVAVNATENKADEDKARIQADGNTATTRIASHAAVAGQAVNAAAETYGELVILATTTVDANKEVATAVINSVVATVGVESQLHQLAVEGENKTTDHLFDLNIFSLEMGGIAPHTSIMESMDDCIAASSQVNKAIMETSGKRLRKHEVRIMKLAEETLSANHQTMVLVSGQLNGESGVVQSLMSGINIGLGVPEPADEDM
ncbi:hypothetical protein BC830DRAFT_1081623 [Chytriomyces sp. MP71]|nr:hypothetical protein BC830DRAFT_1081623 [Chytriomyces sp. MP71]